MSNPLLRATSVGIHYDGRSVARPNGVSFALHAGEVTLLLGPSGSGKSALASALNGLVPHAMLATLHGRIEIQTPGGWLSTADAPVATLAQFVSMVFQDPDAALTSGTVFDEVCFGPENLLVPINEVRERAEQALRTVGLWDRRDARPEQLSGGGRQRLAIAGALAMQTSILVLDEPTANLDPAAAEEVMEAIAAVVASGDRAVLLIEHDLDGCIDLVDRVLVLDHDGHLVIDGPARETLRDRADELVALGVWLPRASVAALALRDAGVALDPLPLRPAELTAALNARADMPSPRPIDDSDADRTPLIDVRQLTVAKHNRTLLDRVDLTIGVGEFVAIVGVNGAGKTTLLQSICAVTRPPKRSVFVDGLDVANADASRVAELVGYVFQNPEHQFIAPTVAEELAHGLLRLRLEADDIDARVTRMLQRFGLECHRDAHPFTLSGGQKRHLSVGTALIAGQRILALDEPTFGQDRARAAELMSLLSDLHADGTTVLVVTHDLQLVADAASRVIVVADGRIAADGPTDEVLAGDDLVAAGLRRPPLASAMRGVTRHHDWQRVTRFAELGGAPGSAQTDVAVLEPAR